MSKHQYKRRVSLRKTSDKPTGKYLRYFVYSEMINVYGDISFDGTVQQRTPKENIMRSKGRLTIHAVLIVGFLYGSSAATAAEKTLDFQLVTKLTDPRAIEAPNVPNQMITQSKAFGVGIFKDGRIAIKDFVAVSDLNKGVGSMYGYSTYTFDDGSTITAHFTAEFKANQPMHGEYKILSGTGVYAGATGTGTLDSVPNQFKGANLLNIKLKVMTP